MGFLVRLSVLLLLLAAAGPSHAEETLRYAGATTLQRFFMPEVARLFGNETAIRMHIEGGNTDPGINALLKGEIDLAGAGRFLTAAEKQKGLVEHLLGWDVLEIVVNEKNPVSNLNMAQLQGIFAGEITNWREVGGSDGPIIVVTCPKGSGMRSAVQELILKEKPFVGREIVSAIVAEADQQVAMFPGSITAVSRSMLDASRVKGVSINGVEPKAAEVARGSYPLAKPLTLVTKGVPQGPLARFLALVRSPQGKAVLARHFVPVE